VLALFVVDNQIRSPKRSSLAASRSRLETLLLADQFRFPSSDWRSRAICFILGQLRDGKSPAPFSLTDSEWNLDLLTILAALPSLKTETPYRIFSVRIFNDSKRFDEIKPALVAWHAASTPNGNLCPLRRFWRSGISSPILITSTWLEVGR